MKPESLQNLINIFRSLPGIGRKQSERIAYYLLLKNQVISTELMASIKHGMETLKNCIICNNISDRTVCDICTDSDRTKQLLIVESPLEVFKFEEANIFKGKYHVLKELVNLKKDINNSDLNFDLLETRLNNFKEVILAISPTLAGEVTSAYISSYLKNFNIKVSKLAMGIPIGANVEYVDEITLKLALHNRREEK